MVIQTQYPQFCFLDALPDIVLTGASGTVNIKIYAGDYPYVEEVYTPDSNQKVTIRGLREFITDRVDGKFNPNDYRSRVAVVKPAVVHLSILAQDVRSTEQIEIDVVPTRVPFASNLLDRFLVRSDFFRYGANDTFFISFYDRRHSVDIDVIHKNGDVSTIELAGVDSEEPLQLVTYRLDMVDLLDEVGYRADEVAQICVKLLSVEGRGVVDDIIIVEVDSKHRFERLVYFDNLFYVPQTVKFYGSQHEQQIYSNEVGRMREKVEVLAHELHGEYVLRSGPLPHSAYLTSQDLLLADSVFIAEGDGVREIAILETDVQRTLPTKEPDHYNIKYRFSEEHHSALSRTHGSEGLFSQPYSKTYD